jgi:L-amino acid N-acyltransferase YncA
MSKILVRSIKPNDLGAITAIYAQAVRDDTATFELDAPDAATMAKRIGTILNAGHPFLVAEIDSGVCGYAYASAFRPRAAFALTVENSVYVTPEAQRQGLGKALLTSLIEAATAQGLSQMVAVIGDSRTKAASIALHASLGFRDAGTLEAVGRKHGQWLDVVLMQRALNQR